MKRKKSEQQSKWKHAKVANLVRYVPSGVYFALVRMRGKLIRRSLKTSVFSVAQIKLPDFIKEQRRLGESTPRRSGKLSFQEALGLYRKQLEDKTGIKETSKLYRRKTIDALLKSWPGLQERDVASITEAECLSWAKTFHNM